MKYIVEAATKDGITTVTESLEICGKRYLRDYQVGGAIPRATDYDFCDMLEDDGIGGSGLLDAVYDAIDGIVDPGKFAGLAIAEGKDGKKAMVRNDG